ncbi:MAG: hypothetical protein J6S21_04765 [Victivallales bacterium]|nr:hypothetical protein [Victivallales bacterium]
MNGHEWIRICFGAAESAELLARKNNFLFIRVPGFIRVSRMFFEACLM